MGKKYLIDTNLFILHSANNLSEQASNKMDAILNKGFAYSFINRIELLSFANITPDDYEKMKQYLKLGHEVGLNEAIIQKTIEIKRTKAVKIPDAIIAATAITEQYILLTKNIIDFKNINRLELETLDHE